MNVNDSPEGVYDHTPPLVSTEWLKLKLDEGLEGICLLDVFWKNHLRGDEL